MRTHATAGRLFLALLAVAAVLDVGIVSIRVADTRAHGPLVLFPAEGPVVYAFWRVAHGYTLYEWPMRPLFTLTAYNVLFYESYARVLQALGATGDRLLVAGRFVTLAWAVAGATLQSVLTWRAAGQRGPRALHAMLALGTWLGGALPGWWALSIRPDIAALVFVLLGAAASLRGFASASRAWLIAASVCFFAGWTFKQSEICFFASVCVYAVLVRRSLVELAAIALPFAAGAGSMLVAAGGAYRANVIEAPSLNPWVAYLPLYWFRSVLLIDLLPWLIGGYGVVVLLRPILTAPIRGWRDVPARSRATFDVDVGLLAVATAVSFAIASLLLTKVGSALNHALELHLAASLLCAILLAAAWEAPRPGLWTAAALAVVPMIAFDAALLTGREQGRAATWLQLKVWGDHLHLSSPAELDSRARLARRLEGLSTPIYIEDEVFSLPWHSNGGRYPAAMVDHIYYDEARRRGLIHTGVDGLLRDRYFGAVVLPDSSAFLPIAVRSGYRPDRSFSREDVGQPPLRILRRDP